MTTRRVPTDAIQHGTLVSNPEKILVGCVRAVVIICVSGSRLPWLVGVVGFGDDGANPTFLLCSIVLVPIILVDYSLSPTQQPHTNPSFIPTSAPSGISVSITPFQFINTTTTTTTTTIIVIIRQFEQLFGFDAVGDGPRDLLTILALVLIGLGLVLVYPVMPSGNLRTLVGFLLATSYVTTFLNLSGETDEYHQSSNLLHYNLQTFTNGYTNTKERPGWGGPDGLTIAPSWIDLPPQFDPTTYNQTWNEETKIQSSLPGLYWNNRLWLLGMKLTTIPSTTNSRSSSSSLEPKTDPVDIFLTVFGMPGDFWNRIKTGKVRCPKNSWYHAGGPILSYPRARQSAQLFATVHHHDGHDQDTHTMIPLEFIPSISGDSNQNNNTLIWHGRLFNGIDQQQQQRPVSDTQQQALRITLHAAAYVVDVADKNRINNAPKTTTPTPILTVDIPRSTGTVGNGGPQIMQSTQQREDHSGNDAVALCVAIYGNDALRYLPEFILHHTNLGFGPIILGVIDATLGSTELEATYNSLQDFVMDGIVEIAAMDLPSPLQPALECEVNVRKQHFYNTCVYHAKGRTPYVGIWDIDEFWMPPNHIERSHSPNTTRPPAVVRDINPWLLSNYSRVLSVGQAMQRVQAYQEQVGCGEHWCYHAFPSWSVWLQHQRDRDGNWTNNFTPRTGEIGGDFGLRETEIEWDWSKSISRTKYANMGGIHQTGSCRYSSIEKTFQTRQDTLWTRLLYKNQTSPQTKKQKCRNLRGPPGFGSIHHFRSLNRLRGTESKTFGSRCILKKESYDDDEDDNDDDADDDDSSLEDNLPTEMMDPNSLGGGCVIDEYIERFGMTVRKQLELRNARLAQSSMST